LSAGVVTGQIDQQGKLIAADPALLRLQERAGGTLGGPLMLPQLSRLSALAIRLEREITRSLLTADDHSDISATVTISPVESGAEIVIREWRSHQAVTRAELGDDGDWPAADGAEPGAWSWGCDAQLRLLALRPVDQAVPETAWQGRSLSEVFELEPDGDGRFPLLLALAEHRSFAEQRLRLPTMLASERPAMVMAGTALFDANGGFAGFRGWLLPLQGSDAGAGDEASVAARISDPAFGALPLSDPRFGRRIDGALRGPLGRIIASAETISGQFEGPIRADYARYAADIAHAGRHLLGLIDDLADLQSIERPGFHAAREAVDLADVARRAMGLLGMKAEEKQIRIDTPGRDDPLPAIGEFRRVLQVMLNLIGNAIRYSPEKSMIWIRGEVGATHVSITVADQGQGLSADQQAVVFEKFERLGRTDTGGSGLGLYIARRLARAMDGDLTVDSAPGQGARFTLSLPKG
jgi:signal transduction histidine kinase